MRIKIVIVLFILATLSGTVFGRTPVSDNTKVQEALADSLNDNGKWSAINFADGTSQTTASGGTVDGSGTTNEITYWVDSDTVGALAVATYPSLTELSYGKGVTSAIQTQLTAKAPSTSPTFATSITGSFLTASEILITDGSKNIVSAAVATYPSLTELTYVKGVSSAIQTQLGLKAPLASPTFTGTVTIPTPFTIGAVSMTATGTELNILDGATLTVTELNYVDGVTSAIQTQFGLKAPLDSPVFTTAVTLPVGLTGVVRTDAGVVSVDTDVTDLVTAASLTAAGKAELATAAETTTGTDATRAVTPDGLAGSDYGKRVVGVQVVDTATNMATGDGKAFFRIPSIVNGWNLVGVAASVFTAGTTGTCDIQIRNITQAADMLTTKITIDSTETDSSTAATPAVIDTVNDDVATGDRIAIDFDVVHTTPAQGVYIEMQFQLP